MGSVARYTVLRILVFLGVLSLLWLVGIRQDTFLLLALSLLVSMVVSYFVLRPFREDMSATIAGKVESRARRDAEEE